MVNEHLGDRLGDWLKTAYDHGVKVLQTQNPTGAAQLLTLLAEQLCQRENQQEAKILGSLVDRVISFSNHQKLLTTLI